MAPQGRADLEKCQFTCWSICGDGKRTIAGSGSGWYPSARVRKEMVWRRLPQSLVRGTCSNLKLTFGQLREQDRVGPDTVPSFALRYKAYIYIVLARRETLTL